MSCDGRTEVYSRVVGFFRPVQQWNRGKKEEFRDRLEYAAYNGQGLDKGAPEIVAHRGNAEVDYVRG